MFDGRGILRGLKGEVLSCGCLVGIYERYRGEVIAMIDAVGPACGETGHDVGQFVPLDSVGAARPLSSSPAQRQRHPVSAAAS